MQLIFPVYWNSVPPFSNCVLQNQLIGSSLTALDAYKTIPTKIRQNVAHPACLMKRQSIVRNDAPQWECFHACPDQWEPRGTIKKNLDYAFFKWFITPPEVEWGCTSAAGKASGIAIAERKAFAFKHLARVHFPAELLDRVGEPFVSNEAMLIELVRTKHEKDSIATGPGLDIPCAFTSAEQMCPHSLLGCQWQSWARRIWTLHWPRPSGSWKLQWQEATGTSFCTGHGSCQHFFPAGDT